MFLTYKNDNNQVIIIYYIADMKLFWSKSSKAKLQGEYFRAKF